MIPLFDRPIVAFVFIALSYCACFCSVSVQSWSPSPVIQIRSVAVDRTTKGLCPIHQYSTRKNTNNIVVSMNKNKGVEDRETLREDHREAMTKAISIATTRRGILSTAYSGLVATAMGATATSLFLGFPELAVAAEPVNAKDTDSVLAIARRKLRHKPPKVLRRKLSQEFAVLLMRSSYDALDEMDCVAMDQFQRDFFLIRFAEYETYTKDLGSGMVQQGDLTDPYYFDFISFAQYKTINREVTQDPPYIFEEQQIPPEGSEIPSTNENGNARFIPVIVKRDPNKLTNKMLIPTHRAIVGATILDKLELTFGETDVKIPKIGYKPDSVALLSGLRQIVQLFLINGYAFKGEVSSSGAAAAALATYKVSLSAPATLWSGKVLQAEGDPLDNDFLLMTMNEYIKRSGYETTKSVIKYDGSNEELTITVR